jgi:hypothetical protein
MTDVETPAPAVEEEGKTPHAGGRPLLFETVKELEDSITAYFDWCDPHKERRLVDSGVNGRGETIFMERDIMTEQKPYTMSGLARHIGIDRDTLLNYGKKNQFFGTIQKARERCHEFAESQLYGRAATGAAFSLKNNWGWKDRQELTGAEGAPLMPIGLDSAILARMQDRGDTPPVAAEDSGE